MNAVNQTALPRRRRARRRNAALRDSESNILTGGSRDYKPEYLSSTVSAANNASASTTIALPIMRNFSSANGAKAQVIEVLKTFYEFTTTSGLIAAADTRLLAHLSTKNFDTTATTLADPTTFASCGLCGTLTTSGVSIYNNTITVDHTDGMGNGILIATDNVYLQLTNLATGVTGTVNIKVLYRIFAASVQEYVGIVQSQQ